MSINKTAAHYLHCEAAGFVRRHENPSCQASSYLLVSAPRVLQPISALGGTTGSYRRGFRHAEKREVSMEATLKRYLALLLTGFGKSLI